MAPETTKLSLLVLCFSTFLASLMHCIGAVPYSQVLDRIVQLPGQPVSPHISQFSGYVTVNEAHGRALFYWFFEARSQPSNKPLLLWLNGGISFMYKNENDASILEPFFSALFKKVFMKLRDEDQKKTRRPGCSSIGYGAASELGPLRVTKNGDGLLFNNYSWNTEANLLFVESPVGVGFSYTNTTSDLKQLNDKSTEDTYSFLVNWLERFPQFKPRDFYISGESYAGHYVPQLAELVYDRNQEEAKYPHINLKGFIVGNPETDDYYDYKGILEYAWSHAVISDDEFKKAKQVCNFKLFDWTQECGDAMSVVWSSYNEIDIYNIYAASCPPNATSSFARRTQAPKIIGARNTRFLLGGYDPCYSKNAENYFNRADVQTALHANTRGSKWETCGSVVGEYNVTVSSLLHVYRKLIKGGLKIWIYSGDADGRVPVIGSRYCIEALNLPVKTPWHTWYHNHQVGGRKVEYEGLTFVTVRGAGHLVPLTNPSEALALIHSFLTAQNLPIRP